VIKGNKIIIISPPESDDKDDQKKMDNPAHNLSDPCFDPAILFNPEFRIYPLISKLFSILRGVFIPASGVIYKTHGGIQIGDSSANIRIIDNDIIGGAGNGITFGLLPERVSAGNESNYYTSMRATQQPVYDRF